LWLVEGGDMKKSLMLAVFFVCAALAVSAQEVYFDIGLGLGKGWTKIDEKNVIDIMTGIGYDVDEMAADFGLKIGCGPFGSLPIYIVADLGGIGHRLDTTLMNQGNYYQFNSYIVGPGVLFYPIPLIQLGLSLGYSFALYETDYNGGARNRSKGGFAWNVSAAVDLGSGEHGCLIGVKYFYAYNTLIITNEKLQASFLGIFVRYTFRQKPQSFF
jgi:hypothetical protein